VSNGVPGIGTTPKPYQAKHRDPPLRHSRAMIRTRSPRLSRVGEETGTTPKFLFEFTESELLFSALRFANAPERQCLGPLLRPMLDNISGEIEVRWNRFRHQPASLNQAAFFLVSLDPIRRC